MEIRVLTPPDKRAFAASSAREGVRCRDDVTATWNRKEKSVDGGNCCCLAKCMGRREAAARRCL
jgi:hypothetical protein